MKRRLTVKQRQVLVKIGCLVLSIGMFIGALAAVPFIVKRLPYIGGTGGLFGDVARAEDMPAFALDAGDFEETREESFEEEGFSESSAEEPSVAPIPDEDALFVNASNLCWYEIGELPSLNLNNSTDYDVDLLDYLEREFPIKGDIPSSEPLVLIIHTHGTESYLPSGYEFYSPEESFRSENPEETVVHIGEVLSKRLAELGIPNYHDKTMYDRDSFNDAYTNSFQGMKAALEKFPSIKYIIDLHRDSIFDSEGNNIKPLTEIDGEKCAQLMLVVGTNGYGTHPYWETNLTFAVYLQQQMNRLYPTLARPINLRNSGFNQVACPGSVIVEAGSCGNTIEEVENAILRFAEAYASMLKEELG